MHTDVALRPAPKIFRETCRIEWAGHTVDTAHNFVRGLSPCPGAWTTLLLPDGKETVMKIYRTRKETVSATEQNIPADGGNVSPTLLTDIDGKPALAVALPGGTLHILELQLAGKRRMSTGDFLRGTSPDGWRLA